MNKLLLIFASLIASNAAISPLIQSNEVKLDAVELPVVTLQQYIGCFVDDAARDLPTIWAGWDSITSIDGCQRLCYGYKC